MLEKLTPSQVKRDIDAREIGEIQRSSDLRPKIVMKVDLDLGTARDASNPYVVSQPFNGVWMAVAPSNSIQVQMSIGGVDKYNTDNSILLFRNSSFYSKNEVKQAVLTWAAQTFSGSSARVTLYFFVGVDFRPGSTISELSGSISLNAGNTLATGTLGGAGTAASVLVTAGLPTIIAPINLNRGTFNFYTDQAIWVGDNNVAVGRGIPVAAGQVFKVSNTAAIYATASGANATVTGFEEGV